MRTTKTQKGITLIALIITIIVLLILAVVAIGAVQNDGIIEHAKNAKEQYGLAQERENTTLGNYLAKLNENTNDSGNSDNSNESEECATCNNTGRIEGYICPEVDCGEISTTVEKQITYWASCNPNTGCGGWVGSDLTEEPTACPECGGGLYSGGATAEYKTTYLSCNHTITSHEEPYATELDCPDCDIVYVAPEQPEGGK